MKEYHSFLSSRIRKLFSAVKDGDLGKLRQLHKQLPLSLSELDSKDSCHRSLCDWILAQNNPALLDWLFNAMLEFYENYYAIHPDAVVDASAHRNEIYWALVCRQNIKIFKQLLNQGVTANEVYFPIHEKRCYSIHLAAKQNQWDVVQLLISKYPALIHSYDIWFQTVLHIAASTGNADMVNYLLQNGARINAQSLTRETALYYAASNGYHRIVKLLLDQGADIHIENDSFNFPIHVAAINGHLNVVMVLLKHDPHLINELSILEKLSPLSFAMQARHFNIAKYLLSAERSPKADLNIDGWIKNHSLYMALCCNDLTTRHSLIALLIENNVNVAINQFTIDDLRILYEATIQKGDLKLVKLLFHKYPELLQYSYTYNPSHHALFMAAKNGQLDIVRYLIKHQIRPPDLWNDDTLDIALRRGHDNVAIELIEAKIIGSRKIGDVLKLANRYFRIKVISFILTQYPHTRLEFLPITQIQTENSSLTRNTNAANSGESVLSPRNIDAMSFLITENFLTDETLDILEKNGKLVFAIATIIEKIGRHPAALRNFGLLLQDNFDIISKILAADQQQKNVLFLCLLSAPQQMHFLKTSPLESYLLKNQIREMERRYKQLNPFGLTLLSNLNQCCIDNIYQNHSRNFPLKEVAKTVTLLDKCDLVYDELLNILVKCDKKAVNLVKLIVKFKHKIIKDYLTLRKHELDNIIQFLTNNVDSEVLYLCTLDFLQQEAYIRGMTSLRKQCHLYRQIQPLKWQYYQLTLLLDDLQKCCKPAIDENFSQTFKRYYKQNCRFSVFENTLRSEMGKKVFSNTTITERNVRNYLNKNSNNNLSNKIFKEMKANSLCIY